MFIVNSTIHRFVSSQPHLNKCQVNIGASDHSFLKRDSYLACDKLLRLRRDEVLREIVRDVGAVKGHISEQVKDQIIAAVKFAVTLSPAEKSKILASLTDR